MQVRGPHVLGCQSWLGGPLLVHQRRNDRWGRRDIDAVNTNLEKLIEGEVQTGHCHNGGFKSSGHDGVRVDGFEKKQCWRRERPYRVGCL